MEARLRPTAQILGIKRTIVVSQHPPRDPMPIAELVLDERDIRQFQHVVTKHGVLQSFLEAAEGTDLAQILRREAIVRGESLCQ